MVSEAAFPERFRLLDVSIHNVSREDALKIAEGFITSRKPHLIVTLNALMACYAHRDASFADVVNSAHLTLPDSIGIVWGARLLGFAIKGRVPGIDLMDDLFRLASGRGYRVYFLGATQGVIEEAARRLKERLPSLKIVGWHDGYLDPVENFKVIEEIKSLSPDMLFVGMGAVRQERWLSDNLRGLGVPLCMGVGGSFDVLSGRLMRAPLWMRRCGLEWLYRMVREPRRLVNMLSLSRFVLWVVGQKVRLRTEPKRPSVRSLKNVAR
jgi:N-acetylglucosaminyldiphosphoundecaprenol N-acetyl-beta-D-mannosaminyltransferase